MMNGTNEKRPKVSIGMPVYNGEKLLRKRLDSLLSQTFADFELIISDNGSTDSTPLISHKYSKKDGRMRYVRQEKNMGVVWNFNFVLQEAKGNYFVWAAVDDTWDQRFLEKNVKILESNERLVGSIGRVEWDGNFKDNSKSNTNDFPSGNVVKYQHVHNVSGSYEQKVRSYLRYDQGTIVYAVYRTGKLQKSMFEKPFSYWDLALILEVSKYGDIHVIDEVLMYKSPLGISTSTKSIIKNMLKIRVNLLGIIFLNFPFTFWCLKHLGIKIFMKNLGWFIRLNYRGERAILLELLRLCKRTIYRQERFWMIF